MQGRISPVMQVSARLVSHDRRHLADDGVLITPLEASAHVEASMPRRGKSPPRSRKGKGSDQIKVGIATAALTATATIAAAAVSGGNHEVSVAPQPPGCVVVQGSVKVP